MESSGAATCCEGCVVNFEFDIEEMNCTLETIVKLDARYLQASQYMIPLNFEKHNPAPRQCCGFAVL